MTKEGRGQTQQRRKKRVRQFNKVGIEIQIDRPERERIFPGEQVETRA